MNEPKLHTPIAANQRLESIDIIRGAALLGILVMNIQSFSMVAAAYRNPLVFGDLNGINGAVYYVSHVFADQKFMTILALIFGVSIQMQHAQRVTTDDHRSSFHYRRMAVLGIFGLLHAYLLWHGDILFMYAVAGAFAYMARYQSPRCLIYWALALITINAFIIHIPALPEAYLGHTDLRQLIGEWQPTQQAIDGEIFTNLSGWLAQSEQRHAKASSALLTTVFYQPRVIGLMLIGMALSKIGFFHRRFNNHQTLLPSFGLFMLATTLSLWGLVRMLDANFPSAAMFPQTTYWCSLALAGSYIGGLLALCQSQRFMRLKKALANLGSLSLTNYLSQSLICCGIFYGWGLGQFGSFTRTEQLLLVVAIWGVQLAFSRRWVRSFHYGPAEWLWRALSYGARPPMHKTANPSSPSV